jgi:hypothetical protein
MATRDRQPTAASYSIRRFQLLDFQLSATAKLARARLGAFPEQQNVMAYHYLRLLSITATLLPHTHNLSG